MSYYEIRERQRRERLADRRHNGIPFQARIVTLGQAAKESQLVPILHQLPNAQTITVQNTDGSLPYLPGYDGPATPGQ